MTITEARRRIKALGGELTLRGYTSRWSSRDKRYYRVDLYWLLLPGRPPEKVDERSIQLMDLPEPSPSEDADL